MKGYLSLCLVGWLGAACVHDDAGEARTARSSQPQAPGYERDGCDPLGPYEPRVLRHSQYNPAPCSMSDRVANVPLGAFGLEDDDDVVFVSGDPRPVPGAGGGSAAR